MNHHFNGHHQQLQVSAHRVEFSLKDGSRIALHTVLSNGSPDRYLRAVPHAAGDHIVDLRKLVPQLGEELCIAEPKDEAYLVTMSLRLKFQTIDTFMSAIIEHRVQSEVVA